MLCYNTTYFKLSILIILFYIVFISYFTYPFHFIKNYILSLITFSSFSLLIKIFHKIEKKRKKYRDKVETMDRKNAIENKQI